MVEDVYLIAALVVVVVLVAFLVVRGDAYLVVRGDAYAKEKLTPRADKSAADSQQNFLDRMIDDAAADAEGRAVREGLADTTMPEKRMITEHVSRHRRVLDMRQRARDLSRAGASHPR